MTLDVELKNYKLPNIYIRDGKRCFLDPIRKKFILETPEEVVRQRMINFLIEKIEVPKDKISVEIPMSYYKKGAKGRADIIVSALDDNHELKPILIVECKAPNVTLTDDVFDQVNRYNKIVKADTIVVTNGNEFIIESIAQNNKYRRLKSLPTYKELVNEKKLKFVQQSEKVWQRPKLEDYDKPEVYGEFLVYGAISSKTKKEFIPFIINLMGLFLDETTKLKPQIINDVNIVKDGGVRHTSFSNSSGGSWTGLYRYFIIKDDSDNNQIISISIFSNDGRRNDPKYGNRKAKSSLLVAIDDFENSHNSLQLNLNRYSSIDNDVFKLFHSGALTVGSLGRAKNKEVINFIKKKAPELIEDNRVYLGSLDNSKEFNWEQKEVRNFIGRIIKYALLRDEFREKKKAISRG